MKTTKVFHGIGRLLQGVLICRVLPDVDIARLLERLNEKLDSGYIPNFANMPDVIRFLEDIYNIKLREPVYLFTEYRKRIKEMNKKHALKLVEKNKTFLRTIREVE